MAANLGLTPKTFGRRFRAVFGCTPSDWLAERRIRDGVDLLGRGFSTKEVAAELGFRDRSSLFRVFRLRLNHTPRQLANQFDSPVVAQRLPRAVLSKSATFLSETATPSNLQMSVPA